MTVMQDSELKETCLLKEAFTQLFLYLNGQLNQFTLPLAPSGSPFMQNVWKELIKIPYGVTQTYGEIAANIGKKGAARAVGMANNKNPIPIFIPCHRVIGANGKLIGYASGIAIKEKLLNLERKYALSFKEYI